jgi:hypothetical protein
MSIIIIILLLISTHIPTQKLLAEEKTPYGNYSTPEVFVIQQTRFNPNNIDTWIQNSGIFDQNILITNTPGFQWPAGSGHYAVFSAGLTTGAMVNSQLRMASASYTGEYEPGYISYTTGHPTAQTDSTFRFYKISRGDNMNNSYDWLVWGRMVPYGAPFIDVDHNGIYEPAIDTPGIRGAVQTLFICLTDGFSESHSTGEGFGGGTPPLYAELHMTAWGYDNPGYQDMIFKKFVLINKNDTAWNSTYTAIVGDLDLGYANDDYIGCDTVRNLSFCYNGDNNDSGNSFGYGTNPPAVGFKWLTSSYASYTGITSFTYFTNYSTPGPACEKDPNGELVPAYNMLKGLKKDQTPWVIPPGGSQQYVTKFCYSGDPETGNGWTEGAPGTPRGSIQNCGGPNSLSGAYIAVNPPGDRRIIMSSGSDNNTVSPNDTIRIFIAELIARGNNYLNSVTKLKLLSDVAQHLCDSNFAIGVNNIGSSVPNSYMLYQNYPNPFNPTTKIKFSIPLSRGVSEGRGVLTKLVIYDVLGKEIATLVNEKLNPGTYSVDWDGLNYPSGVYFYKLVTDAYSETKKMVLIK